MIHDQGWNARGKMQALSRRAPRTTRRQPGTATDTGSSATKNPPGNYSSTRTPTAEQQPTHTHARTEPAINLIANHTPSPTQPPTLTHARVELALALLVADPPVLVRGLRGLFMRFLAPSMSVAGVRARACTPVDKPVHKWAGETPEGG